MHSDGIWTHGALPQNVHAGAGTTISGQGAFSRFRGKRTPALRIADAVACSPLGAGRQRPAVARQAIVIEDDVWIGANVVLLDGAVLRRGCVVGAGSVVRGELPAFSVAVGAPARVIRERGTPADIPPATAAQTG